MIREKDMRVLLVSVKNENACGGIAVWTENYLSGCERQGIACTLVNTETVGKRAQQATAKRNLADEFARTKRIFKDLNKCLKADFDAAHLNTSCGAFGLIRDHFIARKIKKKGIPLVTHYHCDIPCWIHNPISRAALEKLANLSDRNLVLCENSRRYLLEQFAVESEKIPNFIDETLVRNDPKEINENLQRIVFVGRVEEAKGAAELYELARRFPEMAFELMGEVSPQIAGWKKPENVFLLGDKPYAQVIEALDEADLFLLPSHSEGFSMALLEAMARGVPCVATDVGANADMLCDGCGIVAPKGDVDQMERAIVYLQDARTRKDLSCRAVDKVRAAYVTDKVMQKIKELYG